MPTAASQMEKNLGSVSGHFSQGDNSFHLVYGARLTTVQQRLTVVDKKPCTLAQERSLKRKGKMDYMLTNTHTDSLP